MNSTPLNRLQSQPYALWSILADCRHQGPWVCGGAARKLWEREYLTSDIDVFFRDEEQRRVFEAYLIKVGGKIHEQAKHSTTFMWGDVPIQTVHSYFPSIGDVLSSFDFRMCMFGSDGSDLFFGDWSTEDARAKLLVLNKVKLPLYTLARIQKFSEQGFYVEDPKAMLLTLAQAASGEVVETKRGYDELNKPVAVEELF